MIRRRLGGAALALAMGCAPAPPVEAAHVTVPSHEPSLLHLSPLADLVPAGGLRWIVDVRPRALLSDPAVLPSLGEVLPEAELDALARSHGGIDFRSATELVAGVYDGSTLYLVSQVLDPPKVEAAFGARQGDVLGRAVDRRSEDPRGTLTRVWGAFGTRHESLVVFGREAVGLVVGADAPLRASELFAESRLKRAIPAWRASPLDRIGQLLGDAPVRAAAPGPFEGEWATGLGGVLGTATGVGMALRIEGSTARVTVVVTGPWGERAPEAATRLKRAHDALADSGLGRLVGLDHPVAAAEVSSSGEALTLAMHLRISKLIRGLGDSMATDIRTMMARPVAPPP